MDGSGMRPRWAALQVRYGRSVVGADGPSGPREALNMVASKLKLPVIGKG
jgi:hypothetical protein